MSPVRFPPWYVTGIVEGEGSFTFSRFGNGNIAPCFAMGLTARDRLILEGLREYFGGIGRIYRRGPRSPGQGSGFTKSSCLYRVNRLDELSVVVHHFDRFPLVGCKRESYRIWRELVIAKVAHSGVPAHDELEELARKLSAASPRNAPWDGPDSLREPAGIYPALFGP